MNCLTRMLLATPTILALSLLSTTGAQAKDACPPEFDSPNPGELVSTTPTIKATADTTGNCDPNVKIIRLYINHRDSGNQVYSMEHKRGKGLSTGRMWTSGMLLIDHKIPAGELGKSEGYRAVVQYDMAVFAGKPASAYVDFRTHGPNTADTGGDPTHTIVISGQKALNTLGGTDYTIRGGGRLEQVSGTLNSHQVSIQPNDTSSGDHASGHVGGGADGYLVFGAMPQISLKKPGNANVFVNGEQFHTVVISGTNTAEGTDYILHGGGRLEQVEGELNGHSVSIQGNDNVSGNRAEGHVAGAKDGFMVFGPIPQVELNQSSNAIVYVDGKQQ
ncbi:hypothetical protein GLV89_08325 [Halomonas alkaliantarctica]|nr:hypothetical protein [Halomonas alkaliantarctica]